MAIGGFASRAASARAPGGRRGGGAAAPRLLERAEPRVDLRLVEGGLGAELGERARVCLLPERPPIEQERHLLALARLELLDGRLERRELRPELSEQLGRRRCLRAEGGGG